MPLLSRNAALALITFALLVTGCESHNRGKIVGQWKAADGAMFEFTADGRFIASGGATIQGRYSLGSGDTVYLNDLDPPLKGARRTRERISITGDTMNLAGGRSTPSKTFTRVK
ncbi:hypothetical protein GobsT_39420 [Gemmata obscuriglobus]|uniref:DUF5640 domain-containing protein n=1 Tax=Gemmata obscuriglobus TaxID=114 RepID=A0A2Z3H334_9BACT|nr:hypothetical protein [Gemmata obscuriglobus]AWM37986.1 hypothetical protein C1280_13950 [Gemmata obscuriglobus]QEG29153.1 hypothetical protein GobsT_39420 [Gemmata obscuriglobus]VTS07881.1 unnamed protein product [Gemmata obscuriglobus UQM 2246]